MLKEIKLKINQYKNMKHITSLIVLLCCTAAMAQTNFVQVMVNDTLWVKMKSFDYEIIVNPYDYDYGYASDSVYTEETQTEKQIVDAKLKKEGDRLKELQKLLVKNKFAPQPLQNSPSATVGVDYGQSQGFVVTIKTPAEGRRLQDVLKPLNYVVATPKNYKYADYSLQEEQFMKKLVAHSRKKAEVMAIASGQKLGKVIEIIENDIYENLSYDIYLNEDSKFDDANKKMMRVWPKTISVKYTLE